MTQAEKQKVYDAYTAVNNLNTFIRFYHQAIVLTPSLDDRDKLPEQELVTDLLTALAANAVEKMEIVYEAT